MYVYISIISIYSLKTVLQLSAMQHYHLAI